MSNWRKPEVDDTRMLRSIDGGEPSDMGCCFEIALRGPWVRPAKPLRI